MASLLHATLTCERVATGACWVFLGPRWPWLVAGLSQCDLEAFEDLGAQSCGSLAAASRGTDDMAPTREPATFEDTGGESPAAALLWRAVTDWGKGVESATIDRVARAGGHVLLA